MVCNASKSILIALQFLFISSAIASSDIDIKQTELALGLPMGNRLQALRAQGEQGYRNLLKISFEGTHSMSVRWRSLTALGRIGGKWSLPDLRRAAESSEWFLRGAALVAMSGVDRQQAIQTARHLLSDKALMVRMAAVETLVNLEDQASVPLLWEKLYAKENFIKRQSLFIRRRIIEGLARLEASDPVGSKKSSERQSAADPEAAARHQKAQFVRVLEDSDQTLHGPAVLALEKITQQVLGTPRGTLKDKRALWQKWWAEGGAGRTTAEL